MEQQFILRLHESIKDAIDLNEAVIDAPDGKSVTLICGGKKYPGIIVRLPCIVESQKSMDTRQYYKIADVSTLIVVYPHNDFDFDFERKVHEISGLSAPLRYVKARRFRKKHGRMENVEEIEKKVSELLERDAAALSVDIVAGEEREFSDELDIFAAEIESKLVENTERLREEDKGGAVEGSGESGFVQQQQTTEEACTGLAESTEFEVLEKRIEEKRKQMENALNPILQKRFEEQLYSLIEKLDKLRKHTPG